MQQLTKEKQDDFAAKLKIKRDHAYGEVIAAKNDGRMRDARSHAAIAAKFGRMFRDVNRNGWPEMSEYASRVYGEWEVHCSLTRWEISQGDIPDLRHEDAARGSVRRSREAIDGAVEAYLIGDTTSAARLRGEASGYYKDASSIVGALCLRYKNATIEERSGRAYDTLEVEISQEKLSKLYDRAESILDD